MASVIFVVFVSFVAQSTAAGQQSSPARGQTPQPTFRTETRLIVTTVSVKDRNGTPIEGLTAKDFIVTEDGEPQEIAFVTYQRLDDQAPLPALTTLTTLIT